MWFFFAIVFAVISSIGAAITKRVMKEIDEYLYLAVGGFFAIPFLLIVILYFYQIPKVDIFFIWAILASIVIGIFAAVLAYRAMRIYEISLVSPISVFNPVFTTLIAFSLRNLGLVTAISKLGMVFAVIFRWLFFKEKNIKNRLLGTFVMLRGVALLGI